MWSNLFQTARKKRVTKKWVARKKRATHFSAYQAIARKIIHERLAYFAPQCEVAYTRVAIRNQRRRWGSCSSLGNLNFNYRVIFLPAQLCDYVIVHELCHLKQLNHSQKFWDEVGKVMPDYKAYEAELRLIEKGHGARVPQELFIESSHYGTYAKQSAIVK